LPKILIFRVAKIFKICYILINVVNLAGSGKKLTKSTDIIYVKSELTKRSLQNN